MNKRRAFLAAAVVLLAIAVWLMSLGDSAPKEAQRTIEFPKGPSHSDLERSVSRRTFQATPLAVNTPNAAAEVAKDPLLSAMSATPGASNVVIEANALRHSPIGELLIDCFLAENARELEEFRDESGLDPLEDVDRVALSGKTVLVTGNFGKARWDKLPPELSARPYGDHARIYAAIGDGKPFAVWRDELLLISSSDGGELQEAIDRIEGRAPAPMPIDESTSYGEVYGKLSVDGLAMLMGTEQRELAERLRSAAEAIELHVDASGDVAISADVRGPKGDELADLARTFGGALSVARLQAKVRGENELVEFLDHAGVTRSDGQFTVELALPLELLRKHLGDACKRPVEAAGSEAEPEAKK